MTLAAPGTRRIYSNAGFDAVAAHLALRVGEPFEAVMRAWVLEPLGMTRTTLEGEAVAGTSRSFR